MRSRLLACAVAFGVGVTSFAATGCQPLYGSKPERLAKPPVKKRPPEPPVVAPEIKYVEECQAQFRDDPKKAPPPQPAIAAKLVADGDAAIAAAGKNKDPMAAANTIKDAIDKYSNALRKDPYNAQITLQLALAYDAVYRKGCALALLKRIAALETNPKVSPNANSVADQVSDNNSYFKGYRKDALSAVQR